ncbi:MAG: hypothetical protein JNL74_18550, partial [Fibrobacteres bacterium]|nr:hypothetical protein [Fibrobacterota bacterium]
MSPSKYSTVSFLALVGLIFLWANDTWECATRYLYFSSLIAVALVSAVVYFETFSTIPWNAPPEKDDNIPQPGWRRFSKELIIWFLFLTGLMFVSWLVTGFSTGFGTLPWFKRALWAGYMLGVYLICILLIRKYFAYIHAKAMAVATPVLVYLLSTYEIILLDRGVGWHYNNTVIGTVF